MGEVGREIRRNPQKHPIKNPYQKPPKQKHLANFPSFHRKNLTHKISCVRAQRSPAKTAINPDTIYTYRPSPNPSLFPCYHEIHEILSPTIHQEHL